MPTPELLAEADMLARRSSLERVDYLFEVAHAAHRGPDVDDDLRERVAVILAQRAAAVR